MTTQTPHAIYKLYRENPPTDRRGVHMIAAYWHGYDGTGFKFVRYSGMWWAAKAGADNRKRDEKNHQSLNFHERKGIQYEGWAA